MMLNSQSIAEKCVVGESFQLGEVLAWEPFDNVAGCYVVVTGFKDNMHVVYCRDIDGDRIYSNTYERFCEACYRTWYNLFPVERSDQILMGGI